MKILGLLLIIPLFICSCSKYPADIKESLAFAGKNKPQLEKVLDHYSQNPADSLKYKAACFLVRNLRWHYGKQITMPDQTWDEFLFEDSLSKVKIANPNDSVIQSHFYKFKQNEKKSRLNTYLQETVLNDSIQSDVDVLTSGFLFNTIEGAFEVRNLPWNQHLTFEEFCEYILPYRFNNEPIFDIRKKLTNQFQNLANNDSIANDPIKAASAINQYINYFNWDWDDLNVDLPDLGFYSIFYWNNSKLNCANHLAIEGQILRSAGIPVVEIFTPKWKINNLGHSWCGLLTNDKRIVPFSPIWQNPGTIKDEHGLDKASKLFMRTFSIQKNAPYFLRGKHEPIPQVFSSPCIKDVTNIFVDSHDIDLEISETPSTNNLCYFCLFIYREWEPVGWGTINHKTGIVNFKNIPDGIIGIPCIYEDNIMKPCGKLIQTNSSGNYHAIAPTTDRSTVRLIRKYPPKAGLKTFNDEVLGTTIEGSNKDDFSPSVKLSTLTDTLLPYFQDHSFRNENVFRYYRLTAPGYSLHFAELEFLTDRTGLGVSKASPLPVFELTDTIVKQSFQIKGELIGARIDTLAFDQEPLTFTVQKILTIDFGKPERINKIRILPRNADNGINIGDRYELFYWDKGWNSCGDKVAEYNFLQFDNIPAGTIYWLKNTSNGHEEQAFFYENGKQVFMNN